MEYLPTFARTKSPSHVGFFIPAPWVTYGICLIVKKHVSEWIIMTSRRDVTAMMVRIWGIIPKWPQNFSYFQASELLSFSQIQCIDVYRDYIYIYIYIHIPCILGIQKKNVVCFRILMNGMKSYKMFDLRMKSNVFSQWKVIKSKKRLGNGWIDIIPRGLPSRTPIPMFSLGKMVKRPLILDQSIDLQLSPIQWPIQMLQLRITATAAIYLRRIYLPVQCFLMCFRWIFTNPPPQKVVPLVVGKK